MRLLVIGSDRNLFKKNSDIWNRYLDYGKLFEEIHVIVFNKRDTNIRMHANDTNNTNSTRMIRIESNVFVYPTNHICKFLYLWNIYKISKQIINRSSLVVGRQSLVASSQDAFEAGLAGWMIKKLFKIPLQIQIHTDFLSPYFWKESISNKLRVILAKFLIPRADGIRVVSERIKRSLISNCQFPISKISVLPIFVDVEAIRSAPIKIDLYKKYPQFNFIILMASRLTKEKNIGLAIEAMVELVKKYPKLGLVIVGSGSELKNLKLITYNLKLDVCVKFDGWSNDLPSYYKTSDLFLLTSNYEGYGRSVIEAMSFGLPVVMTDVGLAGETIINGENGVVVPVGDRDSLVEAISLILDKKEMVRFGENRFKTIEKLLKKEQYLKLYKESFNF